MSLAAHQRLYPSKLSPTSDAEAPYSGNACSQHKQASDTLPYRLFSSNAKEPLIVLEIPQTDSDSNHFSSQF